MSDSPYIDPSVRAVGVSKLRWFNAERLAAMSETFLVQDNDEPIAVLLRFDTFMKMQESLRLGRQAGAETR